MSQKTASGTALATAHMRAAHQLLDPPPRILEDPVAVAVPGPGAEQRIRELADRSQAPEARALRAHMVLRSRFAEDRLAAAVGRGVTQYVILGAAPRCRGPDRAGSEIVLTFASASDTPRAIADRAAHIGERYFLGSSLPSPQRTTIVAAFK